MNPPTLFTVSGYQVRPDDLWVVATAVCCCVSAGLVGCFLVLRRLSLLGDAISHAILPGLALAFILSGTRDPLPMLAGALVVGVLTAVLSAGLHRWGKVPEDASMGVVFTTLFALGVLLITFAARNVDLDPGCVLYGLIEFVPFDTVHLAGFEVPRALAWLGVVLLINLTVITLFFKELRIVCFDPALATTMGISAILVHYALMVLVAATAVASFESVGSILVVAMLVAPGATAQLLTDRLSRMLWIAAASASVSAIAGYVLAVRFNAPVAGMIAAFSLAQFALAFLFAPVHGFVPRRLRRIGLTIRICAEDMLGLLYRARELEQPGALPTSRITASPSVDELVAETHSGRLGRFVLRLLELRGLVESVGSGTPRLTPAGVSRAAHVIRGHRLWESFLATRLGVDPERVHTPAHTAEHFLTEETRSRLGAEVEAERDPHGRAIP